MFSQPPRKIPQIGLTPLIDVVFILLIFVILAANFDRIRGLKVRLPSARSSKVTKQKTLVLTVTALGVYLIEKQRVEPNQLESTLRNWKKKSRTLLLRADRNAAFEKAVKVLDLAKIIGFEAVSIATRSK